MAKRSRYGNKAWREWWSVHVEAWQRSGLSQQRYCATHRLSPKTFANWLKVLTDVKALRIQRELAREERRERRRRRRFRLSGDRRCQAVQAFWAMHVEALNWSGMSVRDYAAAHRLSRHSLSRWRNLLDDGEMIVDWRARLHPSALPKISPRTIGTAKESDVERALTSAPTGAPGRDGRANRRHFTDEQKLAIVLECERPGASVSAVARAHQLATSALFRWRSELGYGRKEKVKLAAVRADGTQVDALVLQDLLPVPDGMTAVELGDGRRVFAPIGVDPAAVRRQVAEREAAP